MGNIFEGFPKRDKFIKTLSNSYSSILQADKILLSKRSTTTNDFDTVDSNEAIGMASFQEEFR